MLTKAPDGIAIKYYILKDNESQQGLYWQDGDGDGDRDFEAALTLVDNKGLNSTLATLYSTAGSRSVEPSQITEEAGHLKGIQALYAIVRVNHLKAS